MVGPGSTGSAWFSRPQATNETMNHPSETNEPEENSKSPGKQSNSPSPSRSRSAGACRRREVGHGRWDVPSPRRRRRPLVCYPSLRCRWPSDSCPSQYQPNQDALRGGRGGGHGPSCCGAGGEQEAGARRPAALAPWRPVAGVQVSARSA